MIACFVVLRYTLSVCRIRLPGLDEQLHFLTDGPALLVGASATRYPPNLNREIHAESHRDN